MDLAQASATHEENMRALNARIKRGKYSALLKAKGNLLKSFMDSIRVIQRTQGDPSIGSEDYHFAENTWRELTFEIVAMYTAIRWMDSSFFDQEIKGYRRDLKAGRVVEPFTFTFFN